MLETFKGQTYWVPSRDEIKAACLEIQADWSESERYERAGLFWHANRDVYYGDVHRTGAGDGLASPTIGRE